MQKIKRFRIGANMQKIKRFVSISLLISLITFLASCETMNQLISPEKQCSLLRQVGKIGMEYGVDRQILSENDFSYFTKSIELLEIKIIPQLKGLQGKEGLTRQDLNFILDELNLNLKTNEKAIFQLGLNTVIGWFPELKTEQASVTSQILTNFLCLLEGFLSGLTNKIKGLDVNSLNISFDDETEEVEIEEVEIEAKEIEEVEAEETKEPEKPKEKVKTFKISWSE